MSKNKEKKCTFFENKHIWNRLFFSNSYEKMNLPHGEIDQFWLFVQKFSSAQNNVNNNEKRKQMCINLLKKWSDTIPDEWKDVDFLKKKLKEFNCQYYIDSKSIQEFRDIVLMFVDFSQNRKAKKIEKLKTFQQNLPIYQYRNNIIETIKSFSVILVAGDTGCGKSTQLPQYLLQAGYENICCTQPRRLACISLRNRLSVETFDEYGSQIGYQIRFEKHKSKHTKVLFMTEGLLLRQMIENPTLSNYNVIILDEIHERHISCDFLLGAIKCLLNHRKGDLKVILMSATVNCELFSKYFGKCPVIKVPGRLYPIKLEYYPIDKFALSSKNSRINPEPYLKLLKHIDDNFLDSERGDVLVFLSGYLEIETVGETLKAYADQTGKWIILYLHSTLSIAEQDKVFDIAPDGIRKCILSTNIAETSLTIDGIRFVLDSGKVKEMYYDAKIRMQKLQEIWISKASAEQRKGRAGRTGPGVCYRLYSPKDFENFLDFSTPEIKRTSLESLLLSMVSMGINNVRQFPFIESPDVSNIENTLKCLIDYGTLNEDESITLLGRILSKLPVDISIGKMLIMAIGQNMFEYFLSAAACLSINALFSSRFQNDSEVLEQRKQLNSFEGDLFSYINFYSRWLVCRAKGINTRQWCRKVGIEEQRFFEATKLRNQFKEIVTEAGLVQNAKDQQETLTRSERITKHGERKLYRKLKQEHDQQKHKRRKVLSRYEMENDRQDESKDPEANIKDIEFKLIFDSKHLVEIEERHRLNSSEVQLAKMLIAMSFYPQLAIADLDNSFRTDCDQMFHTKDKPFVVLHPTSVFYNQPEFLKPKDIEHTDLGTVSSQHILLGYLSFIETTKTYICNCYSISALHALLLCARQLDTNEDMSRIVCDQWIELQCVSYEESQDMLLMAIQIRQLWTQFFTNMFNGLEENESEDNKNQKSLNDKDSLDLLKQSLVTYLRYRPKYSIKRLLSADVKCLYSQQALSSDDLKQWKSHKPIRWLLNESITAVSNLKKGGIRLANINFNCLKINQTDESRKAARKKYECPLCKQTMHLSTIEWARHEQLCVEKANGQNYKEKKKMENTMTETHLDEISYFCKQCDRQFRFTTKLDILRHRQKHS